MSANPANEEEGFLNDMMTVKVEPDNSFFSKVAANFTNINTANYNWSNNAKSTEAKKKTRILIVEGDEDIDLSKLKDLSINSLLMKNKEKELFRQSHDDFHIYTLSPSTHHDNQT